MYKLSLFGTPSLEVSGSSLFIPRRKARALLAYLAVTQKMHSRESLVTLLWPEYDHHRGRADLSRLLSSLRNALGANCFLTDRESVALNDEAIIWVDVLHFRNYLDACRGRNITELEDDLCQKLVAAVDLYKNDFLAGFTLSDSPAFDEWQLLQTEALRRDLGWALDKLIDAYGSHNNITQAIPYAQRRVGLDPLHEPAQQRLIALYHRNGQRAEAHRQYQSFVRILDEELGVEPLSETKQLYEEIKRGPSKVSRIGVEIGNIQHDPSLTPAELRKKLEQEVRYFLSFDDVRIAYATVGNGPPLVMTATYLRHLEFEWQSPVWQHWLDALAENHTLIRYDERGCGLSEWNVSNISFDAWVRDLEALVNHLSLDRFILLALSQGGPVAIAYTTRHPEKVSHLILHGSYARGRFNRIESPQAAEEAHTLLSLMKLGWGKANPAFRQVFSMQLMPDATKEQLMWFDELMRISMSAENAVRAETVMYNIDVQYLLPEISIPTLVTHCRNDEAIPYKEGKLLGSQIAGARFVSLNSKNHLLLPSEPAWDQFLHEVRRFTASDTVPFSRHTPTTSLVTGKIPGFDLPEPRLERDHPFVARTQELVQLNNYLENALTGKGQIVFVTGGAGRGKTSLLEEFIRRAQNDHPELIAASGSGSTIAGIGDPYLPFRDVMSLLTGDVTTRRTSWRISVEQAHRLLALLPHTIQAILEHGTQLLDVFVPGKQLLSRAMAISPAGADWLATLQSEVARRLDATGALEQTALFGQVTNVLHHLSQIHPLLITLDDLQWFDEASTGLLFYLGRRLAGSRIMIVGAYRPDELSQDQNGWQHLLVQVIDEFKRSYGDIFIDLVSADQAMGITFINEFLDSEPNRLDNQFRQALWKRTGGHPLFTIELLRDMQIKGEIVQDQKGYWCVGHELDWEKFPARVEAVIARRIDRLDDVSRAILKVASVEGELFTVEVLARVLGMADLPVFHSLSEQLGKRHRLVQQRGEIKAGTSYLSSYQFSHALYQQYYYRQIAIGERRKLHSEVAGALTLLYSEDLDQVVVQLAHHYTQASDWNNSIKFSNRAGDLAYQKASLPDAVYHYKSALDHWPDSDDIGRTQILRKLGECLWVMGRHQEALETLQISYDLFQKSGDNQGAAAAQRLLGRAFWELGQQDKAGRCYQKSLSILESEPESEEMAWALAGMSNYLMHLGDYDKSIKLGERAIEISRRLGADSIIIQCLCDVGSALSSKGNWEGVAMEQESLALALEKNRPHDAGRAYLYIGEAFLYLGRYDQARDILKEAVAYTRRMHVPFITEAASFMLAEIDWLTGRWSTAIAQLKPSIDRADNGQPGRLSQLSLGVVFGRLYNDLGLPGQAKILLADVLTGQVNALDPRVALLGELARAEAISGHTSVAASAVMEILEWTDQAHYLYPNIGMALLFICRAPVAFNWPDLVGYARSAKQQLERLHKQYGTPAAAACLFEGRGWLSLAEADAAEAVESFEQAAAQWRDLGHPYDQARASSGLAQALTMAGDKGRAKSVSELAIGLISSLGAQLEDPAIKISFQDSALVQEIRAMIVGKQD